MLLLLASAALASPCPSPATASDLAVSVSLAEGSFAAMDLDGFTRARAEAEAALPCLCEPLTPVDAAAYHRLVALDAYIARDLDRAQAGFRAALAIQPSYRLPSSVAPEGNPLQAIFAGAGALGPGATTPASAPAGTMLLVDGTRARARPTERPAVLQLLADDGSVLWTGWVPAGESLPDWPALAAAAPEPTAAGPSTPARRRLPGASVSLAAGTGVAALACGGLYALALSTRATFEDPATPFEDLDDLRRRTNTAAYASFGAGATALGLGVLAVAVGRW